MQVSALQEAWRPVDVYYKQIIVVTHNGWHFCSVVLNFKLFQWTEERSQTGNHRLGNTMSELTESGNQRCKLEVPGSWLTLHAESHHVSAHTNTRWEERKKQHCSIGTLSTSKWNKTKWTHVEVHTYKIPWQSNLTFKASFLWVDGFVLESSHKIKVLLQWCNTALRSHGLAHLLKKCGE